MSTLIITYIYNNTNDNEFYEAFCVIMTTNMIVTRIDCMCVNTHTHTHYLTAHRVCVGARERERCLLI